MTQSTTVNIKRKIQLLKEEVVKKDEQIEDLRDKLKAATEQAETAETEARSYERKYTSMEEKLDQTEEKLYDAKKLLDGLQFDREEKDRELRKYIGSEETSASLLEHQSHELKEAKDIAQMADYKYEEIARKLVVLTTELELAEKRFEEAEAREEEATQMVHQTVRCIKAQKQHIEKLYDMETTTEEKMSLLQSKLDKMENLFQEKARECDRLTETVDKQEEMLTKKDEEIEKMKQEMESALDELNDI